MIRVMEIRKRVIESDAKGCRFVLEATRAVSIHVLLLHVGITVWNLGCAFIDGLRLKVPRSWVQQILETVAFFFHSPAEYNLFSPWPAFMYLPTEWVLWISKRLPPARLGRYDWHRKDGSVVRGWMYGVFFCPEQLDLMGLVGNVPWRVTREEAIERVKQGVELARRRGASLVGLGAYLPSLTKHGELLVEDPRLEGINLTTGHSCTIATITQFVDYVVKRCHINLHAETVAILGAAGSTGRGMARMLAHMKMPNVLLVDRESVGDKLAALGKECRKLSPTSDIRCSAEPLDSGVLKEASIVIVLTTGVGSILEPQHLSPGTIVLDDSKPRNCTQKRLGEMIAAGELVVIDVLGEVPGLEIGFHYDLNPAVPDATYTCGKELLLYRADERRGHGTVGEVTVERVLDMIELMEETGTTSLPLISFNQPLQDVDFNRFNVVRRRERRSNPQLRAG